MQKNLHDLCFDSQSNDHATEYLCPKATPATQTTHDNGPLIANQYSITYHSQIRVSELTRALSHTFRHAEGTIRIPPLVSEPALPEPPVL